MPNFWHLIQPVAGTNIIHNPSLEVGSAGWTGTVSATIVRSAGTAVFGAWAMKVTPAAGANSGVTWGSVVHDVGSYTVSAYVYGGSGSVYSIGIKSGIAGDGFIGSMAGTTGGSWHRYSFSYHDNSSANRLFSVIKRSAGVDPYYVDGVQMESGTFLTTYIDGDQEGGAWAGAPHASSSSRSGTSRSGGTVVSLASLGLTVLEQGGGGMAPVANIMQEYAIADGALWQRQRATARVLTLTSLMSGTTWPGLHAIRQTVIDAIKINTTPNPQPVRFLYTGAGGTAVLDAYYDGGMQFETRRGFTETTGLRFVAPDPYWTATTDSGTVLAANVVFGSANYIMQRSPIGVWGTMGPSGTSLQVAGGAAIVRALHINAGGTLLVGGTAQIIGGTAVGGGLFQWFPQAQTWGTTAGGTTIGSVHAIITLPNGTTYVGGAFTGIGGVANTRFLAQWTSAGWGTVTGGTANGAINALAAYGGTLAIGGEHTLLGAVSPTRFVGFWTAAGYVSGGTPVALMDALAWNRDGTLYGGNQQGAFGTLVYWEQTNGWGSIALTGATGIGAIALDAAGVVYPAGEFTAIGGVTALNIAAYTRPTPQPLGTGIGQDTPGNVQVQAAGVNLVTGDIHASVTIPQVYAGGAWRYLDFQIDSPEIRAYAFAADATLYLGGVFVGPGTFGAVTMIMNDGAADTYPVLRVRNPSSSNIEMRQIVNTTTGDGIYMALPVLPGETLTLDLRNGRKTFTSDARGNMLGAIQPSSNLTRFRLTPGTNHVSFFALNGSLEASFFYRPRAWSQDDVL